ncbi:VOC family protein [Sinosporangium siamense]|uniref:Glyoxalase n=1 Tax=Sinosporangium siamense TaxID=1367973 RepID=A0A919RDC1_9ACTN|nr:VOC family protein [Sinosporangium siamense]GII91347.1 glyoxalase [Sinosporangium siamense]
MNPTGFYPVIATSRIDELRDFYTTHFGFRPTFTSDWYISLVLPEKPHYELAILDHTHPTIPEGYREPVRGLLLNFEVDDVDAEYERLVTRAGLPLALPLRDEDFGQRHFIVTDPTGVLIDVITPTPPTGEYTEQYVSRPTLDQAAGQDEAPENSQGLRR